MRLWPFLLNFQDPASVYAYSLMFVHHQVMWYMILILAVVYWSFYRIIKDYTWHSFNRRSGLVFIYLFHELLLHPVERLLAPLRASFSSLGFHGHFRLSQRLLRHWVRKDPEFWGYQSWGRLATTLATLLYATRRNANASNPDLLSDKYVSLSSRHYVNRAFLFSSTTTPSKELLTVHAFRENLFVEYVWATFPSLVIFLILIPSLYLLYSLEERVTPKFYIKVLGHQWFWSYEFDLYDRQLSYQYDSNLVLEADLQSGAKRLLEVDRKLYLPLNVPLRILITSSDVLHSWAVPELGIKVDAVPGRLNDALTLIRRPGVFYGQCSELCGVGHGFMPIAVEALSYRRWIDLLPQL